MAYVPGFKHDVFISYAQVTESEWVKEFLGQLQKHLDRELKQTGVSSIFWDRQDLDGDSPLTAEITQSISSTATLVIVLSNAYLDRPWCRKERETFFNQVGVDSRRAFLVHLEDVPLEKRPPEILAMDVLGFKFHEPHPHSEKTGINHPLPITDDGPFDARIRELVANLRDRLEDLRANPSLTRVGANRSRLVGTKVFVADGIEGPRVKDLQEARSQLRSKLADKQVVVLPVTPGTLYEQFVDASQRDACATQVENLMQEATVVVQLLGASGDEDDYESWLCERAKAVKKSPGKDLLLWRPQSLKEASIKTESHRALVFSSELQVIACDLADFEYDLAKRIEDIVIESAVKAVIGQPVSAGASPKRGLVVVDNDECDEPLSTQLLQALERYHVGYTSVLGDINDFTTWALSGSVDGIVFIFGNCNSKWANQRYVATRTLWKDAKPRPRIGVFRADPQRPLPTNVDAITVMQVGDENSLKEFAEKIREVAK